MNSHIMRSLAAISHFTRAMLHAFGRFGSAVAEFQRQQNRLAEARLSLDAYMIDPAAPPEDYEEFLARTVGQLRHEPSARARLTGHGVH
jgi:hypothetical protein